MFTADFEKRFAGGPVIRIESLRIPAQAGITVLFGASGSGKTTVLRCLAGLERPEAGRIHFGDTVWLDATRNTWLPSQRRHVGFVPQDYALFPHLTVARNLAFGLHGLPAAQRRERIAETMRWLGLEEFAQRLPDALSGGQQQRVALGRALVTRPRLLLLDEPLSALDAPTRVRVRTELRRLLIQAAIPTLLVTHDRLEALALGDAMAVIDGGRILQHGPVHTVISRPANATVANIVGVETVQPGHVVARAEGLATLAIGEARLTALAPELPAETRDVYVCIRAEDVILTQDAETHASPRNRLAGVVSVVAPDGPMMRVSLDCGFPLAALLTKQACEEMALREGARVLALVKAPHIHVVPR